MNAHAEQVAEDALDVPDTMSATDGPADDGRVGSIGEPVTESQDSAPAPVAVDVEDLVPAPSSSPTWAPREWHGRMLVDRDGKHLGKLQDVYVDVESDEPKFATVKEGLWPGRHLTFVPLSVLRVDPEELRVDTTAELVSSGPDLAFHGEELSVEDESALYHYFQQNYEPLPSASGRRLARR